MKWLVDFLKALIKGNFTGWIKINFHKGSISRKIEKGEYRVFDK